MTIVGELEQRIFNTITSLGNRKKQPNEDTIYYIISKTETTKSMNKETLQEALNELVNSKKLKVKLRNGKKSYYIENDSFHKDKNNDQVIENIEVLFTFDHETPYHKITLKRRTLVINEIGNNTNEIYDLHKYMQSLAPEMETMKSFITEQFYLLKRSISEINSSTDVLTIALLKPQIFSVGILSFYCKKTRFN